MSFTEKEVEALNALREFAVIASELPPETTRTGFTSKTPAAAATEDEIDVDPFAEAQGLTEEVSSFEPSAPVASITEVQKLVDNIDKVLASGSVLAGRNILKGALQVVSLIKGII